MNSIKAHLLDRLRPQVQPMTTAELIEQLRVVAPHRTWTEHDTLPPRFHARRERIRSNGRSVIQPVAIVIDQYGTVVCASRRDHGPSIDYCVQNDNGEYDGGNLSETWYAARFRPSVKRSFDWFKGEVTRQFPNDAFKFGVSEWGVYWAESEGKHYVHYTPFPLERDGSYEPWAYSVRGVRGPNDPPSGTGDFLDVAVHQHLNWTIRRTPELAKAGIDGVWEQAKQEAP